MSCHQSPYITCTKCAPVFSSLYWAKNWMDEEYRKRRDTIANVALNHKISEPIPIVEYTKEEHACWIQIYKRLLKEHKGVMSERF